MATNDQKQQARKKREAAQAAAAAAQKRNRNLQILAGIVFVAILAVIVIITVSGSRNDDRGIGGDDGEVAGVTATKDLLAGIPQDGLTLGDPKAPVTLVEFLDVQCPFCKDHQLDEQPKVINSVVRNGKARITAQPVALPQMGEDSEAGRTVMMRMAAKDAAWNFMNLFYFNQGDEATGYVTDDYLRNLVAAVPKTADGVTTSPADANREPDEEIAASLTKIDDLSEELGVTGTPTFAIGKTGQPASSYEILELNGSGSVADQLIAAVNDFEG